MANPEDLEVLKSSHKTSNKKRARHTLGLAVTILLLSIACGVIPGVAAPTQTAIATIPAPPTFTSTPAAPSLTSNATIACQAGPGGDYELVINLQAGEKAEIIGKSEGFWEVKTSDGAECWVPDQDVTLEGEVAAVPNVEPPPTPLPQAPAPPISIQAIGAYCSKDKSTKPIKYINQFHLSWQDMSNNEDGFRVYRDGDRVAELPADKTELVDEVIAQNNRTHYYYVTAYNAVGESKSEVIALTCEGAGSGGGGGGGAGGGGGGGGGP